MDRGYIKLWRKFGENELWKEHRVFSKAEAWLDILMQVQHKAEPQMVSLGMTAEECKQGQSLKSLDTWAARWGWNKSKVRRFLTLLKRRHMIDTEALRKTTRLTVLSYDTYNDARNANETQTKHKRNANETQTTPDKNVRIYKIAFDRDTGKFTGITNGHVRRWSEAYPAVEVKREVLKMQLWLDANPSKHKKNYERFITNWLGRQNQDSTPKRGKLSWSQEDVI